MKNQFLFIILSAISGALIPVQASTTAAFSKVTGNAISTALVVFITGLIVVSTYALFTRTPVPSVEQLKSAPLYGYAGGFIVAFYVIIITIVTPKLGVGPAIGLIITGQIISAVIIEHYGLFGAAIREMDLKRIGGTLLMIAGIYLVMKK